MMNLRNFRRLVLLALVIVLAVTACGDGDDGAGSKPSDALTLRWVHSTSLADWAHEAADSFNRANFKSDDGRRIWIEAEAVDAGQAVSDMLAGGALPELWTAADESWRAVLDQESGAEVFLPSCVSVAQSPLVIAMWEPVARALGWPGRTLGWLDVASLAADPSAWAYYSGGEWGGTLRISHTHPGLSDSGVQTLQALVYAAEASPQMIGVENVEDPIVQASVGAFESAVSWFATDTRLLVETMLNRGVGYLAAGVMYENAVATQGGRDPRLVAIYPFEGTFVATYPSCVRAGMDDVATHAAETFLAHLIDTPAQERALAFGLRPVNAAVPLAAPIDPAYGVNPDKPDRIFAPVAAETVYAIQDLWKLERKDVNLAMVLDVSGSMEGDKIAQVRRSAVEFVRQMGDDDRLTIIIFSEFPRVLIENQPVSSNREGFVAQINDIHASGGTSLYDSIAFAAESLTGSRRSGEVSAMVVLTDGMDTASTRFTGPTAEFGNVVQASGASVYTIAYGGDADRETLRGIALATNGIAYEGDVNTIGDIYGELSASFGGAVGIGR